MKKYRHEAVEEPVSVGVLATSLLDEIEHIYRPLFEYIENHNYQVTPDHFTPIRILMPLIEVASRIEFDGQPPRLLERLEVPEPAVIWQMFRHGLFHHVRPFYAVMGDARIGWAIPQYPCDHYASGGSIGIYAPKLLNDLESYLKQFRYNTNQTNIQTGIKLFEQ